MFAQSPTERPVRGEPIRGEPLQGEVLSATFEPLLGHKEPRNRRSLTIPLLALAATLLVLSAAAVAFFGFQDGEALDGSTAVDACVVGTWTVVDMAMELPTAEFGVISFTSVSEVGRLRFGANGKGYHDYGGGSELRAEVTDAQGTRKVSLRISGVTTFNFLATENSLTYLDVENNGRMALTVLSTGASSSTDLVMSNDSAKYSCEGSVLTVYTEENRITAHRSGV